MIAKDTGRIRIIDSFRGIAALSVIVFHVFNRIGYNQFNYGLTGVDLFFMISGFVIFLTLKKCDNWKVFVASRISRLYPVYWTCVTITALLIFSQSGLTDNLLKRYFFNLTMFQNYFKVPHLDFPYWTLVVEMQFYMLMLILYVTSLLNKIEIIGVIICVFLIVYGTIVKNYMPDQFHFMNNAFPLLNHFPLFFSGILFYQLKFKDTSRLIKWILLAGCFALAFYFFDFNERVGFLPKEKYVYTIIIYFSLFAIYTIEEKALFFLKPFVFLGTISYSLYLIHQYLAFNIIIPFLQQYFNSTILIGITCILILLLIAIFITYTVEKPNLYRFKNFLLGLLRYNNSEEKMLKEKS